VIKSRKTIQERPGPNHSIGSSRNLHIDTP
jgi:hypothetical protein